MHEGPQSFSAQPRAFEPGCLFCAGSAPGHPGRSARVPPFLSIFRLVLMLDESLYAPGIAPPESDLARSVRLSLIGPNSPTPIPSREAQDVESLSAWVLELDDFGLAATARQQGRGGFWGELLVGQTINAQANGFLTRRGDNASGAFWYATHTLQVRSGAARLPLLGAPDLFLFLSLEDELTRNQDSFEQLSALPGAGVGLRWKVRPSVTATLTSGANVGLWLSLKKGSAMPGFSVSVATLDLRL